MTWSATLLLLTGCGQADDPGPDAGPGPSVTEAELGGDYRIERLEIDAVEQPLVEPISVTIDAEFGGLRIDTACGDLLGAYSLLADGRAGFTVAGGSNTDCSAEARDQSAALIGALGRVDRWTGGADGIDLESQDGDRVSLGR